MVLFSKVSSYFKWIEGRQGSGYSKLPLLTGMFPLPFDFYLLKFPEGTEIPEHTDKVDVGFRHYRFNIILKKSPEGGEFISEKNIIDLPRVKFFRPDLYNHSVTKVKGGTRWVLSFGFLLKNKVAQ